MATKLNEKQRKFLNDKVESTTFGGVEGRKNLMHTIAKRTKQAEQPKAKATQVAIDTSGKITKPSTTKKRLTDAFNKNRNKLTK